MQIVCICFVSSLGVTNCCSCDPWGASVGFFESERLVGMADIESMFGTMELHLEPTLALAVFDLIARLFGESCAALAWCAGDRHVVG